MNKKDFIKLILECMNEEEDIAGLGGGAETDDEEISIRADVLKQVELVTSEFKSGLQISKKEIKYTAEEEQIDPSRLYVSDILFERIKNKFYNNNQMKHVTFLGTNAPMIKDEIIQKLDSNPTAVSVVATSLKGSARWPVTTGTDITDDEIDAINKENEIEPEPEEPEELNESIKNALRKVIVESLEEIKVEQEDSIMESMEAILAEIKKHSKSAEMIKTERGNFIVEGCGAHQFDIRPMYEGSFDVVYFKNKSDREKKFNLDPKTLKEYVKSKLTKEGAYVLNAYNKNAENQKDQVKKVADLPENNKVTVKKIGDTKNENKDYNQKAVLNEDDLPDKPMSVVKSVKKLSDYPVKGEKAKYEYPSKSDNKVGKKAKSPHVEKLKGKKLK